MKKKLPNQNEGIYSVSAAQFAAPALPVIKEYNNKEYVYYGLDNLYPQKLIEMLNGSAMHNTCKEAVSSGIFGEGIETIGSEYINSQGETIDDIFEKIALDYTIYSGYSLNVIWNKESTRISEVYHLPFANVRSGKKNDEDEVEEYYYSSDWSNLRKNKQVAYKAFDQLDSKGENASQIFYFMNYTPGQDVYPLPSYVSASNDIILDNKISRFHVNNISNGLAPSLFISMRNGIPDPESRRKVYEEIQETYAGEEASGRFFLSFSDPDNAPEITPIEAANSDFYITLEERVTSRILTAWRITSPLLLGIRDSSGFSSNAEEIRVSYMHFEGTVIEPKRKKITSSFGYILKLAGYNVNIEVIPNRLIEDAAAGNPDDLASPNIEINE